MLEIWKPIPILNNLYEASNFGRIKRLARDVYKSNGVVSHFQEKILTNVVNKNNGYCEVCISLNGYKRNYRVHRLVCYAFLPNPKNKPLVNHIDSNKQNNKLENLEWSTSSENNQHAFDFGNGNSKTGEDCLFSKITEETVKKVYTLSKKGDILQKDIAKMFGITRSHVSAIKLKKAWKKVTDKLDDIGDYE